MSSGKVHYARAATENKVPRAFYVHSICDHRTAMAFGEFGFLNGSALQKRTETEKGAQWIYIHIYNIIPLKKAFSRALVFSSSRFARIIISGRSFVYVCMYIIITDGKRNEQ